ncbi:hypothetical protein RHSP_25029 [Rhizobium freirei PRF 81]|uniref:Uncharacterized protein n=1 Tax=Rhizobium freirei PRF 81 TaxID=363754 RepID=N6V8A0_9HYPH|nr:hypothetical protein RHSP_25029 [Rhizobium freirei PRF 81]
MRGMGGIAHQHDMRIAVEMAPLAADQAVEIQPGRAADMAGIGHQRSVFEHFGKQVFAEGDGAVLIDLVEAVSEIGFLGGFDNEGRGLVVELVDMRLKPTVVGLAKIEGEGVEELVGAEPDIAVRPGDHVRLEDLRIMIANARIEAVRTDDQIGVRVIEVGIDVRLEDQFDIQRLAAFLQDVQEFLAADADEAVARCALARALEQDFDVVPMVEGVLDLGRTFRIPFAHRNHGRVGEDDAPAEGIIGAVALDDADRMLRVELLHQKREVEPCGAAADTDDAHRFSLL